jgi:hypothetical protein
MSHLADVVAGVVKVDRWDVADLRADTFTGLAIEITDLDMTGHIVVGSPTGGSKGDGTINAEELWQDGVRVPTTTEWSMTLNWAQGAVLENGDVIFTGRFPSPGTINALKYKTASGSFTAAVKINGTVVTGLSAVAVSSSSYNSTNATAANTPAAGDEVSVTLSAATGGPEGVVLVLWGPRAI